MTDITLGLSDLPTQTHLYVGEGTHSGKTYLWYTYADGKQPVFQQALTGYLTQVLITGTERKGKTHISLETFIQTTQSTYVIHSWMDSNFSKTLLLALAQADLTRALTISVHPGRDGLFSKVHDAWTTKRVQPNWKPGINYVNLVNQLQLELGLPEQRQSEPIINPDEFAKLKTTAKKTGYSVKGLAQLLAQFNFRRGSDITRSAYPQLLRAASDPNQALSMNAKGKNSLS